MQISLDYYQGRIREEGMQLSNVRAKTAFDLFINSYPLPVLCHKTVLDITVFSSDM